MVLDNKKRNRIYSVIPCRDSERFFCKKFHIESNYYLPAMKAFKLFAAYRPQSKASKVNLSQMSQSQNRTEAKNFILNQYKSLYTPGTDRNSVALSSTKVHLRMYFHVKSYHDSKTFILRLKTILVTLDLAFLILSNSSNFPTTSHIKKSVYWDSSFFHAARISSGLAKPVRGKTIRFQVFL